jgi:leucyl aminopeptidase (aminopeptidase T)
VKTSGLITKEIWGNLPGGEVFTVPADAQGVFMCDATLGDDFYDRFGDLQRTPLKIEIANGYLVRATSDNRAVAKAFEQYCTVAENSDRVGEFAFGTNVALRDTIGNLLQDEKIPGVHIAFGRTCPTQTGATWDAKTHIDVIARDCDAWVDGLKIMERGRYLI